MKKQRASQAGLFNLRVLTAFALCSAAVMLAMFSLAASSSPAVPGPVAPIYVPGDFTFTTPLQLPKPNPVPAVFFIQDAEPEIKIDIFGNIYTTAINGVPGGVDLWKSINEGTTFVYMGQPDGAQDKCQNPSPQCLAAGGADDSIDVSSGGYLYVSSLYVA